VVVVVAVIDQTLLLVPAVPVELLMALIMEHQMLMMQLLILVVVVVVVQVVMEYLQYQEVQEVQE
jgi:hypothetical protein